MREPYKPRLSGSPHAVTTELLGQMGGIACVAEELTKKPHVVQGWTDPAKSPGGMGLVYAARLTEMSGSPLLPDMLAAYAGGWFVPASPAMGSFRELTAGVARLSGELVGQLARVDAPTPHSARQALFALHELQRVSVTLRAHLMDVARSDSG